MKTLEEFKSFYENTLVQALTPLEVKRKEYSSKTILITFIWIFGILSMAGIGMLMPVLVLIPLVAMIVLLIMHYSRRSKLGKFVKENFKKDIISPTIEFIQPSLVYEAEKLIPSDVFAESKIFTSNATRYNGDDLISGKIDQTEIAFSEIHAEDYTKDKDGKKQYHTIFKGVFFVADFHKNFNGETFVLTDIAERIFGSFGKIFQKMNTSRPELVKLENVVFEKEFVVYSTDQIESRYIITPVLMEKILELNAKYRGVQFSFINSKIFVAIPKSNNLFEPNYYSSLVKFDYLKDYFELLSFCISLVNILELNNRIWSKE